jgi:hypothetical protein
MQKERNDATYAIAEVLFVEFQTPVERTDVSRSLGRHLEKRPRILFIVTADCVDQDSGREGNNHLLGFGHRLQRRERLLLSGEEAGVLGDAHHGEDLGEVR